MNKPTAPLPASIPRYRQIYEDLYAAIQSGSLQPGDRLPSEAQLGERYKTSRITVAKAVNELSVQGLVTRRAGSGTHVLAPSGSHGHLFGALIPDFGHTEIFEPICRGMMQHPVSKTHSLLWGHFLGGPTQQEKEAESLCHRYIAQKVSGVFFAPLEFTPHKEAVNRRIVLALDRAGIKVVLLDRCYAPYPMRSKHDLVGIDNRQAGFLITQHLLRLGVTRITFVAKPGSANTVLARIAGFQEALLAHGLRLNDNLVCYGDPEEPGFVRKLLKEFKPEALVCANDITAARVMVALAEYGVRVPQEMRIVGIDDVKYASLLPVPLTTQHQNCNDIGALAMITMLQRVENPSLPTVDVLLHTRTVIRSSCGAHLHSANGHRSAGHKPRAAASRS
ncbi:MAG TPA: substrate-binding domain-containing protein [Acidobacteriaceae bacterium]|nr:substrate-binding domain-containing protein [Acidobacteriaceae bacterium]